MDRRPFCIYYNFEYTILYCHQNQRCVQNFRSFGWVELIRNFGGPPYWIYYDVTHLIIFYSSSPFIWYPYQVGCKEKNNPPSWTGGHFEYIIILYTILYCHQNQRYMQHFRSIGWMELIRHFCRPPYWIHHDITHLVVFYSLSPFIWYPY